MIVYHYYNDLRYLTIPKFPLGLYVLWHDTLLKHMFDWAVQCLVCSTRVWSIVGSIRDIVKLKTITLALFYSGRNVALINKSTFGVLWVRTLCHSGTTYQSVNRCFSFLASANIYHFHPIENWFVLAMI